MKIYDVSLTALGPVHIGCGEKRRKDRYIYDRRENRVYIPDDKKILQWILEKRLQSAYEDYFYKNGKGEKDLFTWFKNNQALKDYKDLMKYSLDMGRLSQDRRKRMNDLQMFIKGGDGAPYIPGSSLKGALRTILLADRKRYTEPNYLLDYLKGKENLRNLEKIGRREDRQAFKEKLTDKVDKDIMADLIVSDSQPLSLRDLIVVQKLDEKLDGRINEVPVYRESLRPGTKIHCQIKIKSGSSLNFQAIKEAIEEFYADVDFYLLEKFGVSEREGMYLYLGGGSGFASKTITYPIMGNNEKSTALVGKILGEQFKKVPHQRLAKENDVSPQVLKIAAYQKDYLEMGLCKINFKEVKI